ncbi:MAG: M20/M25/M40 family metallo-hydrolase [Asgard group archaeon]|nr:M20/M25/M40 family metallo-hydrolase [Asgard group archaeon]
MNNSDEVLEKLLGKSFTQNTILHRIKDLCLLGSRFSGTESEKNAQQYMIDFLSELNVSKQEYEFEYQGWWRGACNFYIRTDAKREFPAISLVLAPSTPDEGTKGRIIDCGGGSVTEMNRLKEIIPGNIAMVHSGNTEEGWLHRRIKYANAYKFGASGFIFANHNPGQLFPTGSVRSNRIGEIPAIGISKESYEYIKEMMNRYEDVTGKITVYNNYENTTSKHIIWEIPGVQKDEVIIIGGHYDGHDIAQGATDNAASIAVLLELTKLMVENNYVPYRTIRFIAFAVEEFGVVGSNILVNDKGVKNIVAMINFDGLVGHIPKHIACNGYEELYKAMLKLKEELLYEPKISKSIITASDNFPYMCKGIPNFCVYGEKPDPRAGRGYGHTSADTFDKISKVDAKLSLAFALVFIDKFSKLAELPKRLSDSEVVKILRDAKLEENLKLLEKWPFK